MSDRVLAGALTLCGALLLVFALAPGPLGSAGDTVPVTSTSTASPVAETVAPSTTQASRPPENESEAIPAPPEGADRPGAARLFPVSVSIPRIEVTSSLVDLGLNPDRTIEVPSDYDIAGWYEHRAVPGQPGPGVILGHVDSHEGPAVFFELSKLVPGDTIDVMRSDGSMARFAVSSVEQHAKSVEEFPTERVYAWTDEPTLRLITCGGDFDRSARSYQDNIVVFAELVRIIPAQHVVG